MTGRFQLFPVFCSVLFADVSGAVHKQGKLDIDEYCSVDLDKGASDCIVTVDGDGTEPRIHPRGKAYDFWLQRNGKALYLIPQNGAALTIGDLKEVGFQGCGVAHYAKGSVRTNEGRYAEMKLEDAGPKSDGVAVTYITWEKAQ